MESLDVRRRRFVSILFSITQYIHSYTLIIIIIITIDFFLFVYLHLSLLSSAERERKQERTRQERREKDRKRTVQFSSIILFLSFFLLLLVPSLLRYNWHENAPSVVDELHRHPQIIIEQPIGVILISNISSNINDKQHFWRNNSKQYQLSMNYEWFVFVS